MSDSSVASTVPSASLVRISASITRMVPELTSSQSEQLLGKALNLGAAYRNRTDDLRITRGTLPGCASAGCTDATRECHHCTQNREIFRSRFHDPFHALVGACLFGVDRPCHGLETGVQGEASGRCGGLAVGHLSCLAPGAAQSTSCCPLNLSVRYSIAARNGHAFELPLRRLRVQAG